MTCWAVISPGIVKVEPGLNLLALLAIRAGLFRGISANVVIIRKNPCIITGLALEFVGPAFHYASL